MRDVTPDLATMLTESHTVAVTVDVYYDGRPVQLGVPVVDGALTVDGSQAVPASATVVVPQTVDGTDLAPTTPGSPLGCDGQRLYPSYLVSTPGGTSERVGLDWLRVHDWDVSDGTVALTCTGLEAVVQEARLLAPTQIPRGTAYATAARTLVDGLLPLTVTAPPGSVGTAIDSDDDRLGALLTLVSAWGARMRVDSAGIMTIGPGWDDQADPVVFTLTDGEGGTVVHVPSTGSRDGVFNAVIARGEQDGDSAPVSAGAYLTDGPRRWNGPYGNVPYFYASPLLTTNAQCTAAARTRLASLQGQAEAVTVEAAPDPRIEVGDVGRLVWDGATRVVRVDAVTLPLTAAGGTMTIVAHVLAGRS